MPAEYGEPLSERELEIVKPEVIVPVGRIAIHRFLGRIGLADAVGAVHEWEGRLIVPLPHPSGANLWLNAPENRLLLDRALDRLKRLRAELSL